MGIRGRHRGRIQIDRKKLIIICAAIVIVAAAAITWIVLAGSAKKAETPFANVSNISWESMETQNEARHIDSNGVTSVFGIDVSSHQGTIDWQKVKEQGVKFVMIRLGFCDFKTGELNLDKSFKTNVEGATKAGIDVGVYFFSQALNDWEAKNEAEFVLANLKDLKITYPVTYDLEDYTASDEARAADITAEQATKNCVVFCDTVKAAGYTPMIYTNTHWAQTMFDLESLSKYPIWYASYKAKPELDISMAMWQYTNEGTLDGIESEHVDMNMLFVKEK